MNPQLAALFGAHKNAILGTAAAGVVGLALLQRKKAASGPSAGPSTAPVTATAPRAITASPAPTGGYDSSASDVYNTIQPELEQLMRQQQSPIPVAPAPIASGLYAANRTGNYVRGADGSIAEVESDGSLYGLTPADWAGIEKSNGGQGATPLTQFQTNLPKYYNVQQNVQSAGSKYGLGS